MTASGDASLRLVYGGTVQEINIALIKDWNSVDPRLQNAPWHTVNGKHYGVPYQWGPNVLMYNTKVFQASADVLERGLRRDDPAGWQVQQGPRPGLRRPDLHRRCGAIPEGPQSRTGHHRSVRADSRSVRRGGGTAASSSANSIQRYWPDATTQIEDFTTEGVVACDLVAVPGEPAAGGASPLPA